jgi:hypothetical protein
MIDVGALAITSLPVLGTGRGNRPGEEVIPMAKAKRYRSAISGRYVTRSTAVRHKRTTVAESTKTKGKRKK